MRRLMVGLAAMALTATIGGIGAAQVPKAGSKPARVESKAARATPADSHRTLTGTVETVQAAQQTLSVKLPEATARPASTWVVGVGKQTLLLRAGRNGQFSAIEFADLARGETVQAVVNLEADPGDRSHRAWWLVAYPAGTRPAER